MKQIGLILAAVVVLITACVGEKSTNKTVETEVEEVQDTTVKADITTVCQNVDDTVVCFNKPQTLVIGKHKVFSHFDSICLAEDYTPLIRQIKIGLADGNDSVTQKINRQLLCMYFDKNVESIDEALEGFGNGFFTARLNAREIPAPKGMRSYRCEYYTYEGGAHGFTETRVFHFDAKTGDSLSFENIFRFPIENAIDYIYAAIDEMEDVKPWAVTIPRAFYFDKNGVKFIYAPYDIDCYAAGTIEVLVPYMD